MKISIVGGAGVVGSTSAYRLAQEGIASEIILFDVRRKLAEAHAFDIEQAVTHRAAKRVRAGEVADTGNSDLILLAAPEHNEAFFKPEHFAAHASRVLEIVKQVLSESPSALWIVVTNPVDPLVYLIHRELSVPRNKVIGLNYNDTKRFRWAIGKVLSAPSTAVDAFTLGQHGRTQVPLFSSVRVDGKPVSLSSDEIDAIRREATSFSTRWAEWHPGRTAGWTTAESIGEIVTAMASGETPVVPCSICIQGEYGLRDVSLGVPVRLAQGGVKEIVEFPLQPGERKALEASADAVREMIKVYTQRT